MAQFLVCLKGISQLARGFNPDLSKRLVDAGYKFAIDPSNASLVDAEHMVPSNPNYTVSDLTTDHPEDVLKFAQDSKGLAPAESGLGRVISFNKSFEEPKGLDKPIRKSEKKSDKKSKKDKKK
jgi:hypothetical protein